MSTLKKFCEENKKYSKKFAVVAFHDPSVKTFQQFDALLVKAGVIKSAQQGKDLKVPFPVLLDASGSTTKAYKPRGFPKTVLIDPTGRLVSCSNRGLEMLGEILRSEEVDLAKLSGRLSGSAGRHINLARELERASGVLKSKDLSTNTP